MAELQSTSGESDKEGLVSWDQLEEHMHKVDRSRQDLESRVEGIRRAQSALRRQVQERVEREPGRLDGFDKEREREKKTRQTDRDTDEQTE